MRIFRSILIGAILGTLLSCAILLRDTRPIPKYNGVDPKAEPLVDEWLSLAEIYGLKFDKSVTVGFMDIDRTGVVGQTNYSLFFREIDLDKTYWEYFTITSRTVLVWHEMTHAYCDRGHDYGPGKEYKKDDKSGDGFFGDNCPRSLMYPYIIEDSCFLSHGAEYVEDMFQNCDPY
jgi:hypothetical protein